MSETATVNTTMVEPIAVAEIQPPAREAFYGIAGDFVHLIENETEASPVGLLANFLVMAGTLIGRDVWCCADGATHYPAEFVVLVGETGRSRKGTASRHVFALADKVEPNFQKNCVRAGLSTGEGLVKNIQDGKALAENNNRFLWKLSEFGQLLTVARREGNTISAILRQAWDGDPLQITTKTDPISVSDYFISLVGHVTPEEMLNGFASGDFVNGFANRFLFVKVEGGNILPEGGNYVDTTAIVNRLRASIEAVKRIGGGQMKRNEEAKALWDTVYRKLRNQPKGLKGSLCVRADAHCLRLSLIYALLDGAEQIQPQHVEAAVAFWDYCERSIADIFSDRLGDPDADKILAAMKTGPQGMTDLHLVFHRNRTSEWITAKLAAMMKAGLIVQTEKVSDRKTVIAWDRKR